MVIDSAERRSQALFQDVSWPEEGGSSHRHCGRSSASLVQRALARLGLPAGILDERAFERLYEVIAWAAGGRMVPLARRVPALREAAARRLLRAVALQNAASAVLWPRLSWPGVLTLNQSGCFLGCRRLRLQYGRRQTPRDCLYHGGGQRPCGFGRRLGVLSQGGVGVRGVVEYWARALWESFRLVSAAEVSACPLKLVLSRSAALSAAWP